MASLCTQPYWLELKLWASGSRKMQQNCIAQWEISKVLFNNQLFIQNGWIFKLHKTLLTFGTKIMNYSRIRQKLFLPYFNREWTTCKKSLMLSKRSMSNCADQRPAKKDQANTLAHRGRTHFWSPYNWAWHYWPWIIDHIFQNG